MKKLTNERLKEIAGGQNTVSIPEAVELASELLSLTAERDEVVGLLKWLCKGWDEMGTDLREMRGKNHSTAIRILEIVEGK
jgi:hypothetical protein